MEKNGLDVTIGNDMEKEIEVINHKKDHSGGLIKYVIGNKSLPKA